MPNVINGLAPNGHPTNATFMSWANKLTAQIDNGRFTSLVQGWLAQHTVASLAAEESAAAVWAQLSNDNVCTTAIPISPNQIEGMELDGQYFTNATPVIELSIAEAGVRLAGWLNLIFEGRTGF
jgi:hypothetical protein